MMSETLKAVIVDAATGEVTERPLTADEIAEREVMQAEAEAQQAEANAKVAARESALAKLKALGLTQAEISAL
jgi:vacuolar-type H+-ATPase subunit E/Vma4